MEEIMIKNEYDDTRSINLDVSTFRKDETHPSKMKKAKDEMQMRKAKVAEKKEKRNKKIKNFKLFGKAVALSMLCVASGKTYQFADNKVLEYKEDMAMDDYYSSIAKVIMHSKYFLTKDGIVDEDKYAYHYDRVAKYIDHEENNLDSITYQNKTVEIKDFYLASAVNYFKEYYGDVNQIVAYMSTTGNNNTLDEYVKTLGYSTVDEYVDSIYQINYGLKKDNVTFKKAKSIK